MMLMMLMMLMMMTMMMIGYRFHEVTQRVRGAARATSACRRCCLRKSHHCC